MQPGLTDHRQLIVKTLLFLSILWIVGRVSVWAQIITLPQPEIISSQQGLPQAFVPGIVQDHQGFIWMATRDGLCRYDGNQFKVFQPTIDGKPGISSSSLSDLQIDQQGHIWVFSDQNDIDIIDPIREIFTNFSRQPFVNPLFSHDVIDAHFLDRQGCLWISFFSGKVVSINPVKHRINYFKRQPIPSYFPSFSTFVQDQQGTIWMSDKTGLYRFDQQVNSFVNYPLPDNDIRGVHCRPNGDLIMLSSHSVLLLKIQTGSIRSFTLPARTAYQPEWHHTSIVSDSHNNTYFNQYEILFRFSDQEGVTVLDQLGKQAGFRSLFVDQSDVLWGGTNSIGLLKYNLRPTAFTTSLYQYNFYRDVLMRGLGIPYSQLSIVAKANELSYNFRSTFDKAGKLWFNVGNNLFYQADLQTKRIKQIPFPFSVPLRHTWADPVTPLATDPEGKVWTVTDSLVVWYSGETWKTFPFPIRTSLSSTQAATGVEGKILQLVVDANTIWLATDKYGLYGVNRTTGRIASYKHQPSRLTSLSSNQLLCLFADPLDQSILWIGTFGSGLCRFDKKSGICRRFTTTEGLPNNVIYAAIPDQQRSLCIATNQGICLLNRKTFQTRTYTHEDGLLEDEFNRFHFMHLPDDQIILGGAQGMVSFYPGHLHDDVYQPLVQITDIRINNQSGQLITSQPAQAINQLDLPYDQNFITVGFAAMQYNRQAKIRYRYQLIGLNQRWIESDRSVAEYTDLRWGKYSLWVNASNTSGIWSKHVRVLTIIIRPPWWAAWWALVMYCVLIISLSYGIIRAYLNRQETDQLKAVDAMKARFFTNITHEFRTPLTLILAPVEQLRQRLHTANDQKQLDIISQNANQLLGMVNQLMDLSKAEAHVLTVRESQGDLVEFLTRLINSFEPHATAKGIQIIFRSENINTNYWFDADKLERIVSNLLANALKFTPMGGRVIVKLTIDIEYESTNISLTAPNKTSVVHLEISDNGIGISSEKIAHIFDRFFRIDGNSTESQDGMGIGLALVKELVEIQNGTIQVSSKASIGTTFVIDLPYRIAPTQHAVIQNDVLDRKTEATQKLGGQEQRSEESPIILVVEDNATLSNFITDNLSADYQTHRASNGAEGWEKALNVGPDLIISDVLMPIMDGYEFCRRLKADSRTSHIPVILLTAKASIDSKLQGLSTGADDYMTKPFYVQELQLRVRNLLEQQRQLRQRIAASLANPGTSLISSTPADTLIEKLCQLIEDHLDDAAFGVDELTLASGMSRMNLHRKLKALVDTSTGEFIRNYRLKRAAQLLRQGRSVSETAYLVGFEDPSYFARSFRKLYQITPSNYSRRKEEL